MEKEDLFKEISLGKVNLQLDSIINLKSRAGILAGFTVAFLGFILSNKNNLPLSDIFFPIYLVLFSFFIFTLSLIVKNYYRSPNPKLFYENYKDKELKEIKEHLIKELNKDFSENLAEISGLRKMINLGIVIEIISIIWIVTKIAPLF